MHLGKLENFTSSLSTSREDKSHGGGDRNAPSKKLLSPEGSDSSESLSSLKSSLRLESLKSSSKSLPSVKISSASSLFCSKFLVIITKPNTLRGELNARKKARIILAKYTPKKWPITAELLCENRWTIQKRLRLHCPYREGKYFSTPVGSNSTPLGGKGLNAISIFLAASYSNKYFLPFHKNVLAF